MKGQISAEFLIVLGAVLLIFIVFFTIFSGQQLNLFQIQDSTTAMQKAYAFATVINYVYTAGEGASYNYSIVKSSQENINISDFSVEVARGYSKAQAPLVTADRNTSTVNGGYAIIRNNGGRIEISQ
ncbi:class III signal peptide-containing protein [Candidatus Micrarchaeota archaeon]|nr:class III signal peptide-containing protein [Candidatus Micrarchaeota archaeon]